MPRELNGKENSWDSSNRIVSGFGCVGLKLFAVSDEPAPGHGAVAMDKTFVQRLQNTDCNRSLVRDRALVDYAPLIGIEARCLPIIDGIGGSFFLDILMLVGKVVIRHEDRASMYRSKQLQRKTRKPFHPTRAQCLGRVQNLSANLDSSARILRHM